MRVPTIITLVLLATVGGYGTMAHAVGLPGTVQPGQIERQFQQTPEFRADQPDQVTVPDVDQPAPSNAEGIRFTLHQLQVSGATVYSEDALLAPYRSRLGTEVALSEIYQIANALTARYRNEGYILSRVVVPAQAVEGGVVRLQVIEGYIASVAVEGADGDRRGLVQRYAESIRKVRPLTAAVLERYMLLINDIPGAFAQATVKSAHGEPGAAELTVKFTQRKIQAGISADNRGGKALGPLRLSGDIRLNSVFGLEESTSLRYVGSGDEKLNFVELSHDELIGSEGGKLNLALTYVRARPKELNFIPLHLETESESASLTYSYPLLRSRAENLYLRGTFSAHNGKTEIFNVEDTRDRIRAVRIGASFDLADSHRGLNLLDFELSHGINGLGSSDNHDMLLSRPAGRVDFSKATLYAARLQSLTTHWSLLAAVSAQYAFTDLLSSELFSFGGEQFGRGYDPSELVGDDGVAAKLELRYSGSLPTGIGASYTCYGFYDIGKVHQRSPGGFPSTDSAASAGAGLRLNLGQYVSGFAEVAVPLTHDVAAEKDRHARAFVGLSLRY